MYHDQNLKEKMFSVMHVTTTWSGKILSRVQKKFQPYSFIGRISALRFLHIFFQAPAIKVYPLRTKYLKSFKVSLTSTI